MNQIYNYNGTQITFQLGDGSVMVNATEMAKPFGKRTNDFLRNDSTKAFLSELAGQRGFSVAGNPVTEDNQGLTHILDRFYIDQRLVVVTQGGEPNKQGTWFHEDVAMEFARWLSPRFAIWCNDRIKELLTKGSTSLSELEEAKIVLRALELQQEKITSLTKENRALKPKAMLMEKVMDMEENIDIGQVAKILELPYGRNTLFKKLRDQGILFKGRNEPKQEYVQAGYFKIKEHIVPRENHPDLLVLKVLVTQRGLEWLARRLGVTVNSKQMALMT